MKRPQPVAATCCTGACERGQTCPLARPATAAHPDVQRLTQEERDLMPRPKPWERVFSAALITVTAVWVVLLFFLAGRALLRLA